MSSDRVPKFFLDPLEGKRRIVWVLFIAQKGVGCFASDRINACGTCAFRHAGCFIILWGGGEGITQGCRFPSVSNENSTRLPFSMQMKFMTRIYWIVTAIKRFSPSLVELASSSPSFKILEWNGKRSRFVNTKNIYIYKYSFHWSNLISPDSLFPNFFFFPFFIFSGFVKLNETRRLVPNSRREFLTNRF